MLTINDIFNILKLCLDYSDTTIYVCFVVMLTFAICIKFKDVITWGY